MKKQQKTQVFKAYILLCAFLLQSIFPIGFMPAAFASGVPVQLCHSVFPMSFLQGLETTSSDQLENHLHHPSHHGHHAGHGDSDNDLQQQLATPEAKNQEFCAFGALNLDDASKLRFISLSLQRGQSVQIARTEGVIQRQRFLLFRSRAPPQLLIST